MKKNAATLILVSMLSLSMAVPAFAGTIDLEIDGELTTFETDPMLQNGRTMVPISEIMEKFGAVVDWNEARKIATIEKDDVTIVITIGSSIADVNGKKTIMDAPAVLEDGRTMVPLRFIAEAFEYEVNWDSELDRIIISTEKQVNTLPERTIDGMIIVRSNTSSLPKYTDTLTMEKAYEEGLRNNSSIKDLKNSTERMQQNRDSLSSAMYGSGSDSATLSTLLSAINLDLSISNVKYSELLIKEGVEMSVINYFTTIKSYERGIVLKEKQIELAEKELEITKTKLDLGMESQLNYEKAQRDLETSKQDLANLLTDLENEYISFNYFLGRKADARYNIDFEAEYEPVGDIDIDYYVVKTMTDDPYLKTKYLSVEQAQNTLDLNGMNEGYNTYETNRLALESAERAYKDAKNNYEQSIRSAYLTIRQMETSRDGLLLALQNAQKDYETAELNYALGQITELQLETAYLAVLSAENNLEANTYNHALLVYSFNHPYLSAK